MDIIPTPGLRSLVQTDGFISSNFTSVYVDEEICNCRTPYRLRFTLAHEIGHFALHREYFSQVSYSNFDEYVTACIDIDDRDHNKMEYQGYTFGGLLLVPPSELKTEFINYLPGVEPLIKEAKKAGVEHTGYNKYVIDHIATKLTQVFEVSIGVITRRINNDQLYTLIP